jgi:phenylacetate-coenzyme A ligase PaaK-like adenylate-forming protein
MPVEMLQTAVPSGVFTRATERLVIDAFRRTAANVPAYRTLLDEQGVAAGAVRDLASFSRACPVLSKRNTFDRFTLDQLSVGGELADVADVLTSSGHGGRFSFGVISRAQASASARRLDDALDEAFGIRSRRTLAINCLPMGVTFSSEAMTVATTSVREDMAVALVEAFGHRYDQLLLVGDPLFLKRLTDHARSRGVDWSRHRINVVIGEEIFGERYRGYLAACLGLDVENADGGYIMSSFGVGELGLHLLHETPATIALRRAAHGCAAFARDLLGADEERGAVRPMIFTFDPLRTFIEVLDPDAAGFGRMTMSMLDAGRMVPLLRYQTGDVVRLLDQSAVVDAARRHGVALAPDLPQALIALRGRAVDALPDGSHVGAYKDALYADHHIARRLTGAFRISFSGGACTMHVQLAASDSASGPERAALAEALRQAMPAPGPSRLVLWPHAQFPFGMTLDYERKFTYYAPAAPERAAGSDAPLPCEPAS